MPRLWYEIMWFLFLHIRIITEVRLNTAKNWKLKLKTKKYCSKINFKCMNSTVEPIFNEKVDEKWNLWVREQYTVYGKVKHFGSQKNK